VPRARGAGEGLTSRTPPRGEKKARAIEISGKGFKLPSRESGVGLEGNRCSERLTKGKS